MRTHNFGRKVVQLTVIIATILILLAVFIRLQDEPTKRFHSIKKFALGTIVEITLAKEHSERVVNSAFAEIARIEQLMGPDSRSEVTKLSKTKNEIPLSNETQLLITEALNVSTRSGGAFDITLGKLKQLWNFDGGGSIPSPAAIANSLNGVGSDNLEIHDNKLRKKTANVKIDLGGIAKGYAVDRAAAVLRTFGVRSASINAGGDLYLLGKREAREWKIAIQHPRNTEEIIAIVPVSDKAVVTSGDYERYFEKDGIRYHHLLNPKTGYPASECQSVTIVAPSTMKADALATAAFVLGPEKGMRFIESYDDTEGFIIDIKGEKHVSSGLKGKVEWR